MPPNFQPQSELPKGYVNKQSKRVASINHNNNGNNPNGDTSKDEEEKIELAYSLKDADRDLSELEIEYETKAEKYNVEKYRRIYPSFGTLAYLFRNLKGGNNVVIGALRSALGERGAAPAIKDFITKYDSLDDYSQKRIDVWDLICRDLNRPTTLIWNHFIKGIKLYVEALKTASIELNKPDLVETINKFARKESNQKDRELAAKVSGLVSDSPLVNVNQTSETKTINNTMNLFGKEFTNTIREVNSQLIGDKETKFVAPLELTEGNNDYIEAEFEDIKEKENV